MRRVPPRAEDRPHQRLVELMGAAALYPRGSWKRWNYEVAITRLRQEIERNKEKPDA